VAGVLDARKHEEEAPTRHLCAAGRRGQVAAHAVTPCPSSHAHPSSLLPCSSYPPSSAWHSQERLRKPPADSPEQDLSGAAPSAGRSCMYRISLHPWARTLTDGRCVHLPRPGVLRAWLWFWLRSRMKPASCSSSRCKRLNCISRWSCDRHRSGINSLALNRQGSLLFSAGR
jgi:hypothetical protein